MRLLTIISVLLLSSLVQAQCYPDRHNTTWFESWLSCEESTGPIESYGEKHWIQYDFGHLYELGEMQLWNFNDPSLLNAGAQLVHVDVSEDGEEWTNLGDLSLAMASGESTYEGDIVFDFDGAQLRYLLLTIEDTHGHSCGGISELRIDVEDVIISVPESLSPDACFEVSVYPNPHKDLFNAQISSRCGGEMDIELYDATGRLIQSRHIDQLAEEELLELGNTELPAGIYFLSVRQDGALGRYQIVKTD